MGFTHTHVQKRSFTKAEWTEVSDHIREILSYVENLLGVPLGDGYGDAGTRPVFTNDQIMFNGIGDDSYETFVISRKRSKEYGLDSFTKTERRPYDVAVTACLCYLSSISETHFVTSDGNGSDFVAGLAAARQAVPNKANMLDIPMGVMQADRWTGPWVSVKSDAYQVKFSIDGKGYVNKVKGDAWVCFETHAALATFLFNHRKASFSTEGHTRFGYYGRVENDIWNATGSFDEARHKRIAKAQRAVLAPLFEPGATVKGMTVQRPLAFVRPGELPRPEETGTFCYSLSDLLAIVA